MLDYDKDSKNAIAIPQCIFLNFSQGFIPYISMSTIATTQMALMKFNKDQTYKLNKHDIICLADPNECFQVVDINENYSY